MATHTLNKVTPSEASTTLTTEKKTMTQDQLQTALAEAQRIKQEKEVQAAMIIADIKEENETVHDLCTALQKQIAFSAGLLPSMIATRVQRLATGTFTMMGKADAEAHRKEHGQYPAGTKQECREEMMELASSFVWCLSHAPDQIGQGNTAMVEIVRPSIEQWLGGGSGNSKIKEEQLAGFKELGYTDEEARQMHANSARATRDYLAVKREHLGTIMCEQVAAVMRAADPVMPDNLQQTCQSAYNFALSGGRVADAILIKDDAKRMGFNLIKPVIENTHAARAAQIREKIAAQQDDRAKAEADKLAQFDPLALDDDEELAAA